MVSFPYYPQVAKDTSTTAAVVFGYLVTAATENEVVANPKEIQYHTGIERSTVRRAVLLLVENGYLQIQSLTGLRGYARSKIYRITKQPPKTGR